MLSIVCRSLNSLKCGLIDANNYLVSLVLMIYLGITSSIRRLLSLMYRYTFGAVFAAIKTVACGVLIVVCMAGTLVIRSHRRLCKQVHRLHRGLVVLVAEYLGRTRDNLNRCLSVVAAVLLRGQYLLYRGYADYVRPALKSILFSAAVLAITGIAGFVAWLAWDCYCGRVDDAASHISLALEYLLYTVDLAYLCLYEVVAVAGDLALWFASIAVSMCARLARETLSAVGDLCRLSYAAVSVASVNLRELCVRCARHAVVLSARAWSSGGEYAALAYPYLVKATLHTCRAAQTAYRVSSHAAVYTFTWSSAASVRAAEWMVDRGQVFAVQAYRLAIEAGVCGWHNTQVASRAAVKFTIYMATDGRIALFQHLDDIYTGLFAKLGFFF